MKIELRPLAEIKPYENNPRLNDQAVDAVAESIRRFGFRQPIVVDQAGVIVVGHTRWKAAQKLGLIEVPVHVATDLTPTQVRAYRIADNKSNETANWDPDKLRHEITAILSGNEDIDMFLLGFSEDDIKQGETKLTALDIAVPAMSWLLVGIPTVRFNELQSIIDKAKVIPDSIIETSVTDD